MRSEGRLDKSRLLKFLEVVSEDHFKGWIKAGVAFIRGTFTGFVLTATTGPKIDYILVPPGAEVIDAAIVRTSRDGRYPSDHFPVTATVRLPAGR